MRCVDAIDVGCVALDDVADVADDGVGVEVELVFDLVIAWIAAIGLAGFTLVICGVLSMTANG